MREIAREMLDDLPSAIASVIAVGTFIAAVAVWAVLLVGMTP